MTTIQLDSGIAQLRLDFNEAFDAIRILLTEAETLERLLKVGEKRRTERSERVPIEVLSHRRDYTPRGHVIDGAIQGVRNVYAAHVRFNPERGERAFQCSCEDARRRGHQVGPCKHVLALGRVRYDEVVVELEGLATGLGPFMPRRWLDKQRADREERERNNPNQTVLPFS